MGKRLLSLTLSIVLLFTGVIGRMVYLIIDDSYSVSEGYNSYSVVIDTIAPNLYYNDCTLINNNKISYAAVIRPNAKCLNEMSKIFGYKEQEEIREELKKGYPVVRMVDKEYPTKYIGIYKTHISDTIQLLSRSSGGLLSYMPLKAGERRINFSVDALGRVLSGDDGKIIEDNYNTKKGLVLTLDKKIQLITEASMMSIESGCAIVMDIQNSSILAAVSKPDNTYLNKPLMQYSVGSVFKIVMSVCALENNIDPLYYCPGYILVGDTIFSCQNGNSHKRQNIRSALAHSCNCYFVNLAQKLGKEKIISTAQKLGFYDKTELYTDWLIQNASMPSGEILDSKGQLAMLGFGQGALTTSPMQICSVLCTIANKGRYNCPRLVSSTVNDMALTKSVAYPKYNQAISEDTADKMLDYMRFVVTNGTGKNAESDSKQSCGKTATAETGQYINGRQKYNTWFAGIYPYDDPKYAIVIMCEDGKSGAEDCCPIFRSIVENIDNM